MNFNQWVAGDNLFHEINEQLEDNSFIEIHGIEEMNLLYKTMYGVRKVPRNLQSLSVREVARVLTMAYAKRWEMWYNQIIKELEIGVVSERIITDKGSDETERETDVKRVNETSAFNDDDFVADNSNDDSTTDSMISNRENERSEKLIDFSTVQKQLEMFNQSFIIDIVMKDISKILTLDIE